MSEEMLKLNSAGSDNEEAPPTHYNRSVVMVTKFMI